MKQLDGLLHVETKCMPVTAKGMHIAEIINTCNQCLNDHPMKRRSMDVIIDCDSLV